MASLCVKPSKDGVTEMLAHSVTLPSGGKVPAGLRKAIEELQSSKPDFSKDGTELNLQVDWTRLFRGVAKGYSPPPPYESVYKDGFLGGPSAVSVAGAYAKEGVGLSSRSSETPDFIGVEFRFMSTLAAREAESWGVDAAGAAQFVSAQREFASEHMRPWISRFCENARKLAKTEFYRAAVDVIHSVFEWDATLLEGIQAAAANAG